MTELYRPSDDELDESSPLREAREQAWEEFRQHPITMAAQRKADDRAAELEPLKKHYNDELTRAKLQFQQDASVPMLELTKRLIHIDENVSDPHESRD